MSLFVLSISLIQKIFNVKSFSFVLLMLKLFQHEEKCD